MKNIKNRLVPIIILVILLVAAAQLLLKRNTPPVNVLWITMDSLRADHLGCTGHEGAHTPTIDALAAQGALFTQCVAQSNYTNISVPSMITGRYPSLVDVRTPLHQLDDFFTTLAEILSQTGYATYGIVPYWPTGINQGLQRVETLIADTGLRTRTCLEILDDLDDRPFFIWLYYWDPHAPYQPPEEFDPTLRVESRDQTPGGRDFPPQDKTGRRKIPWHLEGLQQILTMSKINEGVMSPMTGFREELLPLYDGEIAYVDSEIKKVVDRFRELGLWDKTLVVLNADHGESFGEHDIFFHGYSFYDEEIRVPLIIKLPKGFSTGRIVPGSVRNMDIVPTILDYCRLSSPSDLDGRSLRGAIEKHQTPQLPTCLESNTPEKKVHLVGYRQEDFKLIYRKGRPTELYHLAVDPGERNNLLATEELAVGSNSDLARAKEEELRQALLAAYKVERVDDLLYTYFREHIDPQNRERLKALGYVY